MTDDPSYWIDHFDGDYHLAHLVIGGMTRRKCLWCERELRPCNMRRHVAARHFRQLTIFDVLGESPGRAHAEGDGGKSA